MIFEKTLPISIQWIVFSEQGSCLYSISPLALVHLYTVALETFAHNKLNRIRIFYFLANSGIHYILVLR